MFVSERKKEDTVARLCILNKIGKIGKKSDGYIIEQLKEQQFPVPQNHIHLFYLLPEDGTPLYFKDIAAEWQISKSSLSDIITRYSSLGFIKKDGHCEDKRHVRISITEKARPLKKTLDDLESRFLAEIFRGFSQKEKEAFETQTDKVLNNIKRLLENRNNEVNK